MSSPTKSSNHSRLLVQNEVQNSSNPAFEKYREKGTSTSSDNSETDNYDLLVNFSSTSSNPSRHSIGPLLHDIEKMSLNTPKIKNVDENVMNAENSMCQKSLNHSAEPSSDSICDSLNIQCSVGKEVDRVELNPSLNQEIISDCENIASPIKSIIPMKEEPDKFDDLNIEPLPTNSIISMHENIDQCNDSNVDPFFYQSKISMKDVQDMSQDPNNNSCTTETKIPKDDIYCESSEGFLYDSNLPKEYQESVTSKILSDYSSVDPLDSKSKIVLDTTIDIPSYSSDDKVVTNISSTEPSILLGSSEDYEGSNSICNNINVSISQVRDLRNRSELICQAKLLDMDKKIHAIEKESTSMDGVITKYRYELAQSDKSNQQMMDLIDFYEKTAHDIIRERERDRAVLEIENQKLICEKNTLLEDRCSSERAHNDVQRKYERMKEVITDYKSVEDDLKDVAKNYSHKCELSIKKYSELKSHVEEKLKIVNFSFEEIQGHNKSEIGKLQALLRKAEMRNASLENTLEQKMSENRELNIICDELIKK
ncbi:uncharacterized protein [Lepeophtheirus salmonis]|uniref:uncharacterized protein n=1 Tax=Lepeophtheirus salmonis TaxID=72036 RepID=UPI001AE90B91|nr:uncharacterized protein LOC121126246 [Lepeophtheirus salmonis]